MKKEVKRDSIRFRIQAVIYDNNAGFKIASGIASNAETGKRICRCSVKGQMPDIKNGDEIFASGSWDDHPQYGKGFKAEAYVKVIPMDSDNVLRYLEHGNISGISKKRAGLIVDRFGENTVDVLVYQTERLKEIKGFGAKTIAKIKESAKKNLEKQNMMMSIISYIQGFDISPAYANRIFNAYGLDSIAKIKENPYKLAEEVKGIGFLKADEIALKNNIAPDSPLRVESAVLYTLKCMNDEGDVYGEYNEVVKKCIEFLNLDTSYIEMAITKLIADRKVIQEDDAVYPAPLFYAEEKSAKKLVQLLMAGTKNTNVSTNDIVEFGKQNNIIYADKQIEAIKTACNSSVMILTGGPGTGKTTTINGIIGMMKKRHLSVACAAPTGKAAKRMKEATKEQAQTVHKLLEVHSEGERGFKFCRNEHNPLPYDVVIIDESSMIDAMLLNAILKASREGMKLIFVGDVDQLPSVGCGNVLHEMIQSDIVPVVKLDVIFRQANESDIIKNAHLINEGVIPEFKNRRDGDYFFMDVQNMDQEQIRDAMIEYVCDKLPSYYHTSVDNIQVLAPMKKGHTGVWELNSFIQDRVNPPSSTKAVLPCNDQLLRVGDKVMFTCNDYNKEVFNGDTGIIVSIFGPDIQTEENNPLFDCCYDDDSEDADESDDQKEDIKNGFVVDFDGRKVTFDVSMAQAFVLSYAMTIHKSQGSEFDIVVMPLTYANYVMLQRNLLYTGVTRAKKIFVIFGQREAIATAVRTLKVVKRNTRLGQRIVDAAGIMLGTMRKMA